MSAAGTFPTMDSWLVFLLKWTLWGFFGPQLHFEVDCRRPSAVESITKHVKNGMNGVLSTRWILLPIVGGGAGRRGGGAGGFAGLFSASVCVCVWPKCALLKDKARLSDHPLNKWLTFQACSHFSVWTFVTKKKQQCWNVKRESWSRIGLDGGGQCVTYLFIWMFNLQLSCFSCAFFCLFFLDQNWNFHSRKSCQCFSDFAYFRFLFFLFWKWFLFLYSF